MAVLGQEVILEAALVVVALVLLYRWVANTDPELTPLPAIKPGPRAPSCMFAGKSDESVACAVRVDLARSRSLGHTGVDCSKYINTRKYVEQCPPPARKELKSAVKTLTATRFDTVGRRALRASDGDDIIYPLLVTGAGGAGTNLASSALKQLGVVLGHEYTLGEGSSSWPYAVSDSVVGVKYPFPRKGPHVSLNVLPESSPRFRTVIHQVRCPSKNIAALTTHNNASRSFLWHAAGIDPTLPACVWGAHVWLRWNEHIETYADHRYRIEDFQTPELLARYACELAGLKCGKFKEGGESGGGDGGDEGGDGYFSGWLEAIGLKSAVRGHHREHGECPHSELAMTDPELAAKIEAMAVRYGYPSAAC
eukprot:CAMPEP_0119544614 /NCGR_PEP_ID=MMETSP1344-20130328/54819_1 /TAXON_ID=236787 /ORGANISM="Florenciella parvula, Strain CCMP2471" /LENGTH=365 /DNA_ID=CAMNT_0007589117 /DNA_START=885 /DNA_END=1983 /DNA_ORIENTATION=-